MCGDDSKSKKVDHVCEYTLLSRERTKKEHGVVSTTNSFPESKSHGGDLVLKPTPHAKEDTHELMNTELRSFFG
jgi:hypothetical protein